MPLASGSHVLHPPQFIRGTTQPTGAAVVPCCAREYLIITSAWEYHVLLRMSGSTRTI